MGLLVPSIEIVEDDFFTIIKDILRQMGAGDGAILVTPYIRLDDKIRDVIEEACKRGVNIQFLVRKGAEREPRDSRFLAEMNNIEVFELPYLHAKIYWFESLAIISSMNLYDFSDRKSREIGVILNKQKLVEQIGGVIHKWLEKAERIPRSTLAGSVTTSFSRNEAQSGFAKHSALTKNDDASGHPQGFCIGCGSRHTLNPSYPVCTECFNRRKYISSADADYRTGYCHKCGKSDRTDYAHPLCRQCWIVLGKPSFDHSL